MFGLFAIGPQQQPLLGEFVEVSSSFAGQAVARVDDEREALREKRPDVESRPGFIQRSRYSEFRIALLEFLGDLDAAAAKKLQFEPVEGAGELRQEWHQQGNVDGMRKREPYRSDFAALD